MKCSTSLACLRSYSFRPSSALAGLLLLALAGLSTPCAARDGGASDPDHSVALPAEHMQGWMVLPWFGAYYELPGWTYHTEHGWQFLTARLTGSFHLYDVRLGLWGWSSIAHYPWIYWYGPVHAWTWYARGGTPGERWFHHATAGEWLAESQLPLLTGHLPPMVRVEGGSLTLSTGRTDVATFSIGRHELTWGKWQQVRAWAAANGYDIGSVGAGCAADHPVHAVNWYDALKWCNAKSEMEGLTPVYSVGGLVYRIGQTVPVQNQWADGYRLPLETEWEYAARGGRRTDGFTYSGSNILDAVGWYAGNNSGAACSIWNGRGTWPVAQKAANELGLHDMSGNLWEWCWDAVGSDRRVRGGSVTTATASGCNVSSRGYNNPADRTGSDGLRLARSTIDAPAGMVMIPPGTFTMGSPASEPGRYADEVQHTVTLTRPFYLQRSEVTKAQWDAVAAQGPARGYTNLSAGLGAAGESGGQHPVTMVMWFDAVKWLNLKSELEGLTPCYTVNGATYKKGQSTPVCDFAANGYRLPTEAEWEYACRAGTTTAFYSGPITSPYVSPLDPNLDLIGWYHTNSDMTTHPPGGKQANAWGLFDMSGNVWEWCWDWYGDYPGTVTDPTGPDAGWQRVYRSGAFNTPARQCRSACREKYGPNTATGIGFRPARSIVPDSFVLLPAGSFALGDSLGDGAAAERPVHTVTLSAFHMGRTTVTKKQWDAIRTWAINSGLGYTDLPEGGGKGPIHPVHSVNWFDAVKWLNAWSEIEMLVPVYTVGGAVMRSGEDAPDINYAASGYRLPTEAEWERAARGGLSGKRFPFGDTISHSMANYNSSTTYSYELSPIRDYHPDWNDGTTPYTSPVGAFAANGYGLYDMAGNVLEWCGDWISSYSSSPSTDPTGPASGSFRVPRGGAWSSPAYNCRLTTRYGLRPGERSYDLGFRPARSE